jgi:hypothetical protein
MKRFYTIALVALSATLLQFSPVESMETTGSIKRRNLSPHQRHGLGNAGKGSKTMIRGIDNTSLQKQKQQHIAALKDAQKRTAESIQVFKKLASKKDLTPQDVATLVRSGQDVTNTAAEIARKANKILAAHNPKAAEIAGGFIEGAQGAADTLLDIVADVEEGDDN